jgi:hypothetical protein
MEKLRNELIELIQLGYEYEVQMNIGNGWEPYEECQQNLVMILEDPDILVCIVGKETSEYYVDGIIRYNITLPSWWRKGSIAVIFEEAELL